MNSHLDNQTKLNNLPGTGWSRPRKRRGWLAAFLAAVLFTSSSVLAGVNLLPRRPMPAREPRFAVLSDLHFFDTRLGDSGRAFEDYLNQDPKLLRESEAILDSAIDCIVAQQVNFVLITGDLTKDGELWDHLRVTQFLQKLERHGIQVYVVPGNHDINNPDAVAYVGDTNRPVPGVSPRAFRELYERFGYGQAIAADPHSLSYVAEPARDLWLLAIDSCKYDESKTNAHPVASGRIRPQTMTWIQGIMRQAQARGKRVIAFMHHGVNQHFFGEQELFGEFLVDDWPIVSTQLAATGLKVVFTGHYHSQDAAYLVDQTLTPLSPLCDVETGSLAMYPCAFRLVTVKANNTLEIHSRRVTEIRADTGGVPFQVYAENFLRPRLIALSTQRIEAMFGVPEQQAAMFAPYVADAIIANYAGDETPSPQTQGVIAAFVQSPEPLHTLGLLLGGIWTDLPPGDNELVLPLR